MTERRASLVAFAQKVGIVAGALIATGTIAGFLWRYVEQPVYANAAELDRRHTAVEERITNVLEQYRADVTLQRADMREIVKIIAAPPGSQERNWRSRKFINEH